MILAASIVSMPSMGPYLEAMPCEKLATFYDSSAELQQVYSNCTSPENWALVQASLTAGSAENAGAVIDMSFGMALWLGLAIHAIGIEIYVRPV